MKIASKVQAKVQSRVDAEPNPFRINDRPFEVFEYRGERTALDGVWSLLSSPMVDSVRGVRDLGHAFWEAHRPRRTEDDAIVCSSPKLSTVIEREFWLKAVLRHADRGLWERFTSVATRLLAWVLVFGFFLQLALVIAVDDWAALAFGGVLVCLRVAVCARAMFYTRALTVRLTRDVQRVHGTYYEQAEPERFEFAPKPEQAVSHSSAA